MAKSSLDGPRSVGCLNVATSVLFFRVADGLKARVSIHVYFSFLRAWDVDIDATVVFDETKYYSVGEVGEHSHFNGYVHGNVAHFP